MIWVKFLNLKEISTVYGKILKSSGHFSDKSLIVEIPD